MREIKFRGKTLSDDHKWLYGNLNLNNDGKAAIMRIGDFWSLQSVNPATVGQYTGLKDCAGQEIYEGDIIKVSPPSYTDKPVLVSWDNAAFMVDNDLYLGARDLSRITVIGNVYDSPELLEVDHA